MPRRAPRPGRQPLACFLAGPRVSLHAPIALETLSLWCVLSCHPLSSSPGKGHCFCGPPASAGSRECEAPVPGWGQSPWAWPAAPRALGSPGAASPRDGSRPPGFFPVSDVCLSAPRWLRWTCLPTPRSAVLAWRSSCLPSKGGPKASASLACQVSSGYGGYTCHTGAGDPASSSRTCLRPRCLL